jgi:hypothetical protein
VTRNGVPTATIGSASVSVTGSGHSRSAALPGVVPPHLFFSPLFVMSGTALFYLL